MTTLPFLNRTAEKQQLEHRLKAKEKSFLALYGRRRSGKSRLLKELDLENAIYYVADKQDTHLQITSFANQAAFLIKDFNIPSYETWESLLLSLRDRVPDNTTVIIDEFPYLVQLSPSLPSVVQKLVDDGLTFNLIICGSSQRMMQGLVQDSSEPLYGRAAEIIKLKPLSISWLQSALDLSDIQTIEAFAVWGGIPRYWEFASEHKTLWTAIKKCVFNKTGILHDEPHRILLDDLGNTSQPSSILQCIALGANRLSEIAARLKQNASNISRPIQNLMELGYIKREQPFGEHSSKSKKSLYKLSDPFLTFWYRHVHPYMSLLEFDKTEQVIELCKPTFTIHVSEIWENLCRDALVNMTPFGKNWFPAKRWWGKRIDKNMIEIDIIADSIDKKSIFLGEVTWSESVDYKRIQARLQLQAEQLKSITRGKDVYTGVFAKTMNPPAIEGLYCPAIKDVIEAGVEP